MNHILLFESFNIISHLKERGIDPDKTRVIIDDKTDDVYFFIFDILFIIIIGIDLMKFV